jgi:hypothetical protein
MSAFPQLMVIAKESPARIVATDVPADRRQDFLLKKLGAKHVVRGENLVYAWLGGLAEDYRGGEWRFVELSNGAFYLAPRLTEPLHLRVPGNGFDGTLDPDAAGLVATLFALNQIAWSGDEAVADTYYHLLDYVHQHPQGRDIFRAID